ncbi:adhesion G protein-coupled receptor A3-like [Sardina pilchardus]|uniref:adhesion G protein-coupled receptor A3-like n=1 Tax=Sardina pilchardus TaxID=27697 RepID=UPI002E136FCD
MALLLLLLLLLPLLLLVPSLPPALTAVGRVGSGPVRSGRPGVARFCMSQGGLVRCSARELGTQRAGSVGYLWGDFFVCSVEMIDFVHRSRDLRNNLISRLEPGAFRGLAALKRLDLSNNRIGCLSPEMFLGLGNLTKLNLSGNIFSALPEGVFAHLLSLRALHFSTDSLFCDCQLEWLLLWARSRSVRIGNDTLCVFPTSLQGMEVRSLPPQQLTCDGPLELPLFQLIPSQRQVVFRGDRLPLQCTVSYLEPALSVTWSHDQQPVLTQEERGIYVEEPVVHDCCLVTSELILSNIDVSASGIWQCHVTSSRGNSSRHMEIVVLETSAPYCAAERVSGNKGDFRWPKTLAGIIVTLHCAAPKKTAWRRCDRSGRWAEEDYTQCPYASEVTRALHQLTQMAVNNSNALTLAQQLASFTSRAAHFGDVMDVIFVTHLVERITRLVGRIREKPRDFTCIFRLPEMTVLKALDSGGSSSTAQ